MIFGRTFGLIMITVLMVSCWGCGTKIGTKQVGFESAYRQINTNALYGKDFSSTSQKVLSRYNLEAGYKADPKAILKTLQEKTRVDNRRDLLFALAELNYHAAGGPVENRQNSFFVESRQYYLNAAVFAYFYLFETQRDLPVDPYSRNFRWACDLYNIALARALADVSGKLEITEEIRKLPRGSISMYLKRDGLTWDPKAENGDFLAADEMEVFGLSHRNRESGIGVPFIVVEDSSTALPVKKSSRGTLVLRVEGGLSSFHQGRLDGQIELYTPLHEATLFISGTQVPLEKDLSVQLAHNLNQPLLWDIGFKGFFTGEHQFKNGIYEFTPYHPGKIPVVFVHGTLSNPIAWAEMCNTLMADPVIRERFHFWFYLYDSNRPVSLSALYLRGALKDKLRSIDPDGNDPLLNEMVVVGHSQGGLLTKFTATKTEDRIIRGVTGKGLDELDLSEEQRLLIERTAVFEPLPFVKRVVFIATPHRGSLLISGRLQNIVKKIVSLSVETLNRTSDVIDAIPEENIPEKWKYTKTFTSIDSMSPDNPAQLALSNIPLAPGIKGHSIIAVMGDGDPTKGSDGVVAYDSAHLDYVESEFIIQPGGHSIQWHPLAIEEVRRILHLHLSDAATLNR